MIVGLGIPEREGGREGGREGEREGERNRDRVKEGGGREESQILPWQFFTIVLLQ